MNAPKRIATIALVARAAMTFTTGAFLVLIVVILYRASTGDLAMLEDIVERDLTQPMRAWQIVIGGALLLISIAPLLTAFWSAHRFFRHFVRREIFADAMERTVRTLGWSLVWYWVLDWVTDVAAAPLVTFYEPGGVKFSVSLPLDETIAMPIVGIILVSIARALAEARRLDEDSRLIV